MPQSGDSGASAKLNFESATAHPDSPDLIEIAPEDLARHVGAVVIVDVRNDDEYDGELGHIEGSTLIPLPSLPSRMDEIPDNATVVFVCRSGGRSLRATSLALESGLENVFNMKGGMLRWNELGLPVAR